MALSPSPSLQGDCPLFLRLSRRSLARSDAVLRRLLGTSVRRAVSRSSFTALCHAFAFKDAELSFARSIAERCPQFWVFRLHQQAFAGDFALVDMSSPVAARRPLFAVELKRGERVRTVGSGGVKIRNIHRVAEGLAAAGIAPDRPDVVLVGDADLVVEHVRAFSLSRRRASRGVR